MNLFSIDVTPTEIAFIRQALDLVSISGKDAKFLAALQAKIEGEMAEIERALKDIPPPPAETSLKPLVKK